MKTCEEMLVSEALNKLRLEFCFYTGHALSETSQQQIAEILKIERKKVLKEAEAV